MNTKIKVVDSVMGSGKSTAAINYINNSDDDEKFLFVTPYLDEVERIITSCPDKNFFQPEVDEYATKTRHIIDLLRAGRNIVTTHALFAHFNQVIEEIILEQNYTLIIDEALNTINVANIGTSDIRYLSDYFITFDENNIAHWLDPDYEGALSGYKTMCDKQSLCRINNTWFEILPPSIFENFKEIYILTYMFEGQVMSAYLKLWGLNYEYYHVENFSFVEGHKKELGFKFKNKIHICNSNKMNEIGKNKNYDSPIHDTSLSKGWYERHKNNKTIMKKLSNNCKNFFVNKNKAKVGEIIWTTFKDYKNKVKGKGFTSGFLALNIKATNEYRNRHYIAYMVNRYINPALKINFKTVGLCINEEQFALSEMIQFIWRSAIRDDKEIYLYIPSRRMRFLLQKWLGYTDDEIF